MSPEFHQRVRILFDQALERPKADRLAFLAEEAGAEPEVFHEVVRLLEAHVDADSFLASRPTHRSTRIDRYLVKGELGRGAMGVVYEAVDPLIGRTVAVKVISLEATTAKSVDFMREALFREARSAGVLSHPGIVIIFDVGQENDAAFIAMERVEGPTLEAMLDTGGIPDTALALDFLRQAAAALDYAHANGVVHRDIKPANIMLHKGTQVKIADFGIAKLASAHSKTLTGMIMGTPAYMSPEQVETRPLDGRSDQFSLAVVAFEMLTGTKPFQATQMGPLMHAIVYGQRPSARAANPALPTAIDAVFERAMRRFPAERYASCTEFVAAIEGCFAPRPPAGDPWRSTETETLAVAPGPPPPPILPPPQPPVMPPPQAPVLPPPQGPVLQAPRAPVLPPPRPTLLPPPTIVKRGKNPLPYILAGGGAVALLGGFLLYHFLGPSAGPSRRLTPPPRQIGAAPVVGSFTADPSTIEAGKAATLRWDVKGATEVSIDPGVGAVPAGGTREVKPAAATTYVITAKGPGGNTTARVAVAVAEPPKPPPNDLPRTPPKDLPRTPPPSISAFRAGPAAVKRGERFQLDWSVEGASQVSIDHGVGQAPVSGNQSVLADATTTYTLTATGKGGTTTAQTTVTVPVETASELFDQAVAARRAQQPSKAVGLFQLAANRGDARAMLELGLIYRSGEGVAKDIPQSVSWFEKAANAGNSSGMDYMGAMYANGEGVPKDDRQAMGWYSKAAAAGNPVGMDALGQMYRNGRGVPQNYPEAIRWFSKAAAAGNPSAMYHLGMMYESGWGVDRNPSEALSYYRKAAAGGDKEAARRMSTLERQPAQPANRQGTVRIAANAPWTDTGIDLRPGDQVRVSASGSIRITSNGRPVSPAGLMNNCAAAASVIGRPAGAFPAPNLPCWSLIGRIQGPSPLLLQIGLNKTFTASAGGRLYLGVNDENFQDNTGSWTAVITVSSAR